MTASMMICAETQSFVGSGLGATDTQHGDVIALRALGAAGCSRPWEDRSQTQREQVAANAVANFNLPSSKLRALANKYPPPQSWYDDDTDPF